jgi:hypothetical protein
MNKGNGANNETWSTKKRTIEYWRKRIEADGRYRLLSETYKNMKTKLVVKHLDCGLPFGIRGFEFNAGNRCPHCRPLRISASTRLSREWFEERVRGLVGDEYVLEGDYLNTRRKVTLLHARCGRSFVVKPNCFLMKDRCPHCRLDELAERLRHSEEEVAERVAATDSAYRYVSGYRTATSGETVLEHLGCGRTFKMSLVVFREGARCRHCFPRESRGEREVAAALRQLGADFSKQVRFDECRTRHPLPFDFKVELGGSAFALVEYDGAHHFEEFDHLKRPLSAVQECDRIKNDYCSARGIPLLRIPYYQRREIHSLLAAFIQAHQRSTTIPSGSTLQAIGGGNGRSPA